MEQKQIILFLVLFILLGCNKKDGDLSLEITDKEVKTLVNNKTGQWMVVNYFLENSSNKIYLIRKTVNYESGNKRSLISNGLNFKILDGKNEIPYKIKRIQLNESYKEYLLNKDNLESIILKKWTNSKYKNIDNDIIIIHPHEKLFFQEIINLNEPSIFFEKRDYYVELEKNKKYSLKMKIISDTSELMPNLPAHVLQTIKNNNLKIYNGTIQSKNEAPIEIIH